jgi:hypothetical protein
MNASELRPEEAAAALAQVRAQQQQVIATSPIPGWYWPALGGLMFGFTAGVESRKPAVIAVASVAFAIGVAALVLSVVARQRVAARAELLGRRGGLTIAGFVVTMVGLGLGVGFTLEAAGVAWPATIANGVVAVGLIAFGPPVTRRLQRIMAESVQ